MLSLIFAIVCGALTSIVMRLSTTRVVNANGMVAFNYLTCLGCAIAMTSSSAVATFDGAFTALLLGAANGFLYMKGMLLMQDNMRRSGVILTTTFAKLGVLIPIFLSIVFFQEIPTTLQVIGVVLSFIGIILIKADRTDRVAFHFSLLTLLAVTGGVSTVLKVYAEIGNPSLSNAFLLIAFGVAFALSITQAIRHRERLGVPEFVWGLCLGLPNFFTSRFILDALESIPAVIVYPSRGVGTILLVTLAGIVLFKEYLNRRQQVALATILVALTLLNI